ncbi:aminotransferase class III-fold pyridoxal phosphate-dependent enzyme [Pseudoroseicyclus sp. CXY001]|uniref:aminotransferase class III-fold pyridoxal phosphate-dependent enzyme n=1 Tax=Pseudoroseicyclus sp. CXY001 TaxID=3242492 RepID=UPI00357133B2
MPDTARAPNDLDSFWMPFTPSRTFKENPRLITGAKGIHYTDVSGHQMIDGTGGLWCCNAGHGHPGITKAIQEQAATLDYVHTFNQGHPIAFEAASRVVALAPGFDHIFFTNSGSEAVDTAMKIALAYHRARGEAGRRILVAREKAYHGINIGGTSLAGLPLNKAQFGLLYPHVAHMRNTGTEENRFSRGQPESGADRAEDLQRLCDLHGGQNIAAVFVEPVVGAGGVFPPPKGYLERLREICDAHGILLIFDEVITGFGRTGEAFAYQSFGVTPDLITCAKGITNATVPMGGVLVPARIREAFLQGPAAMPDLFHGYTYSGHPLASAAAIATMDAYRDGQIFENAKAMAPVWEDMLHGLADLPGVRDIRNYGILGAVELEPEGDVGAAGKAAHAALWEAGLIIRPVGDSCAMSPPLIVTEDDIGRIGELWRAYLTR